MPSPRYSRLFSCPPVLEVQSDPVAPVARPVLPVPQSLLKLSRVLWNKHSPGCQVSYPPRQNTSGTSS